MIWHVFGHYGIVASLIYILVEFLIFQILLELLVFSINPKHKRVFENNSRIHKYRWLIFTILLFIKLLIFLNIGGTIQIQEFIVYTGLYLIFVSFFLIKKSFHFWRQSMVLEISTNTEEAILCLNIFHLLHSLVLLVFLFIICI